jgi:hypothetical protein
MLTTLTMSRQAHFPGGLGVPSSNLGAPTNQPIDDIRNFGIVGDIHEKNARETKSS